MVPNYEIQLNGDEVLKSLLALTIENNALINTISEILCQKELIDKASFDEIFQKQHAMSVDKAQGYGKL